MAGSVKVKTQDLSGSALDWAVSEAVDVAIVRRSGGMICDVVLMDVQANKPWAPSTDWIQGGPMIDKYRVELTHESETRSRNSGYWGYIPCEMSYAVDGDTALIAACRAIVSAKIGIEVDVPEVLV